MSGLTCRYNGVNEADKERIDLIIKESVDTAVFQFLSVIMGSFNILNVEIRCAACGLSYPVRIQFKFGNTWQLEYRIGDTIKWGGNDFGKETYEKVKVYGAVESLSCPNCSCEVVEEHDIFITQNVIVGIAPMNDLVDYLLGANEYVVLEE